MRIPFSKIVASGNDFVVIEKSPQSTMSISPQALARKICHRKFGVGADGLLVLEKSKIADVKMHIFNPDGSEAEMCGNGARCVALWLSAKRESRQNAKLKINTKAGIIQSEVYRGNVKIKLTGPKNIKLDIPIKINQRNLKVNFIDTGVPHAVIFVEGLDEIHVSEIGKAIRNQKKFAPRGTNVDFVEVLSRDSIGIRTYERGVEDETLACGTGAVASALLYAIRYTLYAQHKINVVTKSKEILKVYFDRKNNKFENIWLEGKAKIVYKGCWCDE